MRKSEYQNYKKIILEHFGDAKTFAEQVEAYYKRNYKAPTIWHACRQMALDGFFACYYSQVLADLKDVYGDLYDETKYITKNGEIRYRNGEAYLWTIYTAKIATAGEKLYTDYKKAQA